jgi:hypothetical protein
MLDMVTQAQKRAAEQDFRALLDDHGLPQPDEVEYGQACIWLKWHQEKFCVELDIDEHGAGRIALDEQPADEPEEVEIFP